MESHWREGGVDPIWEELRDRRTIDLDEILDRLPPLVGEPAFDPEAVRAAADSLPTQVDTGHPLLDRSVRTGLAHIDFTFDGDHPKYGIKAYAEPMHDGFPPTIIAAVDALSAWGLMERAESLWRYWLRTFVEPDGAIRYYGVSLSEYGQLLHMAALLVERGGNAELPSVAPIARRVLELARSRDDGGLVAGVPEADEVDRPRRYFHNNAWLAKGLRRWATITGDSGASAEADSLGNDTLRAVRETWASAGWLSPEVDPVAPDERPVGGITTTRLGSYTNYRYWPELLSSGLLPADLANRVVDARLAEGGQFCGVTRFETWLDDWPLVDYLEALPALGRDREFLLSLYGHVAYHQAAGHLTAYEQVTFPPGSEKAPYCLPCQLVAARAIAICRRSSRFL